MTPERWQQIERVYDAAHEREVSERSSFLGQVCSGDDDLRREVEWMLEHEHDARRFIDLPALNLAAGMLGGNTGAVAIGSHLGTYEITGHLGKGGMGEVYRARDTKLKRDVAIKILPSDSSADPERVSRFRREAQVLASLNHPNIAAIHGLEDLGGESFLVMELVPGETLAERIMRGPVPIDQALRIAKQIVEALEAAHEKGVIHRDLKPANVKITPDGRVKVLDFGLAKVYRRPQSAGQQPVSLTTVSLSATSTGIIVGTAAYMSPEQTSGRELDQRTDIFSFGCILYEMLTGTRAFDGEGVSEIIAHVLTRDPDWTRLPAHLPSRVRDLLHLCLEKNAKNRRNNAADVRLDIELAIENKGAAEAEHPPEVYRQRRSGWIAAGIAALLIAVMAAAGGRYLFSPPDREQIRFEIQTPDMVNGYQISISPDGGKLAYAATGPSGKTLLFVRPIDSVTAQPLPDTEGAAQPFWSPDSRFIGFVVSNELKKIDVKGGRSETICNFRVGNGGRGSWNSDGVILFAGNDGFYRVSANGGMPVRITSTDNTIPEAGQFWPYFLPDGRHFLYLQWSRESRERGIYVASLDSKATTRLLSAESMPVYAPGYLLFQREGTLFARQFSEKQLALTGEPIAVAEGIDHNPINGRAAFAVASNGTLIYRTGSTTDLPLTWVARDGKAEGIAAEAGQYRSPVISPEGKQLAYVLQQASNTNIWIMDLMRSTSTRFTFSPQDGLPVWSPDGSRIAFNSAREGHSDLYVKHAGGTNEEELLLKSDSNKLPWDWSPDGQYLLYSDYEPNRGWDIWVLPLRGDHKPVPFLRTSFSEEWARFSPDGHWVAYTSNESGNNEIYVQSFPPSGRKWKISTNGGSQPKWRSDGKEIFYVALTPNTLMAVDVKHTETARSFEAGVPHPLFKATLSNWVYPYDVTKDGQHFIINGTPNSFAAQAAPITVVTNWTASLRKR